MNHERSELTWVGTRPGSGVQNSARSFRCGDEGNPEASIRVDLRIDSSNCESFLKTRISLITMMKVKSENSFIRVT